MGVDALVDEAERLIDQLRALPLGRLERGGDSSIAQSAHGLAQTLADLAADLEGRVRRDVPRLHPLASGDQVAVTVHDLAGAAHSAQSFSLVGEDASRGNAGRDPRVALEVAHAAIKGLRAQV